MIKKKSDEINRKKAGAQDTTDLHKQMEKDLQTLYSRNQAMLEAIPDIIMEVDANKVYTWANHAGIEFFGDNVIGQEANYYFAGEQQAYQAVIPIFNDKEEVIYVESWQRRRDGEKRLLAWWYRVLKDGSGNVSGALSSARDITEPKRVEEALRLSEVQLQVILESTADGILAIDNMGKVIKTNKRFAELWQIPQNIFATGDDNTLLNYVSNQLVNPEEFLFKVRLLYQSTAEDSDMLVFKDGRIFERFSAPLFLSDSSIGRVWSFRDVTERERAEAQRQAAIEALRESEDRYRDLVENSQDLICTHDLEGKILSMNETAVRLTGYPLKELLGMNMADLLIPGVRHLFKEYLAEIQAKGWARGTMRIRTASNEPRYWEYYNTLRTKGVTVPIVRALGHDITERERAETIQHIQYNIANAMIKAETLSDLLGTVKKELSSLIDTTNFQVAICDETSGLLSAPCEKDAVPQWRAEKSLTGLVIRQKRSILLSKEQIWQMSQAGTIELTGLRAETWLGVPLLINEKVLGTIVVQSYDKADAYDQNGVSLLEIIANQLSAYIERKRTESQKEAALEEIHRKAKELQEKNEELDRFTYSVAHDLKSPLVTIRTFLGILEQDMAAMDKEKIKQNISYIRIGAEKMSKLLDELLDLSRIGRSPNPAEEVSLQNIVKEASCLVAGRITEHGVKVAVADTEFMLRGDRVRLVEVFQNLLDNACKFMGEQKSPLIEIGVETKDGEAVIYVRDNGMGIPTQFLPKLFIMFEKLNRGSEGDGIGLALVKRIVEVHGGRIWVESEGPDQGTTFLFTLAKTSLQKTRENQ
jgi:PAS domain S-box-containing protein